MSDTETKYETISKYDRTYGGQKMGQALFTRPSTVKNVEPMTGRTETFVIQTSRHEEMGEYIFIECMDETGVTRVALPPKAVAAIASQHESLTTRRRSITGKRLAQERKDRGELPGFMRKKARGIDENTCRRSRA